MKKAFIFSIFIALIFGVVAFVTESKNECINIYVDYGKLDNNTKSTKCVKADDEMNALSVLKVANYKIEGTVKYGDSVVCRVNDLPNSSVESCQTMPPADAYWAVIIKKKQVVPISGNEWGWAQKGINETYLNPGDSIGLVFSDNGKVRFP